MAFASPIPLNFMRSATVSLANSARSPFTVASIFLAKSTAESSMDPVPIKMAKSSESDNDAAPLRANFDLGWSSSAQDLIEILDSFAFIEF
jgi:hypothetical protein